MRCIVPLIYCYFFNYLFLRSLSFFFLPIISASEVLLLLLVPCTHLHLICSFFWTKTLLLRARLTSCYLRRVLLNCVPLCVLMPPRNQCKYSLDCVSVQSQRLDSSESRLCLLIQTVVGRIPSLISIAPFAFFLQLLVSLNILNVNPVLGFCCCYVCFRVFPLPCHPAHRSLASNYLTPPYPVFTLSLLVLLLQVSPRSFATARNRTTPSESINIQCFP